MRRQRCEEQSTTLRSHNSATNVFSTAFISRHWNRRDRGASSRGRVFGGVRTAIRCASPTVKPTESLPRGGKGTFSIMLQAREWSEVVCVCTCCWRGLAIRRERVDRINVNKGCDDMRMCAVGERTLPKGISAIKDAESQGGSRSRCCC